jgi:sigma-B regulation protein RsbU (phosphoserine phosphatase)
MRTRRASRFRDRAELLDYLLEVASVTSETLDLDRLLPAVVRVITRAIPAQLFAILLYSNRRQSLRIAHSVGHRQEIVDRLTIALGEGITGQAAQSREPVLVRDVRKEPNYLPSLDAVRCELAVPMIHCGKLVGVIDMQSTEMGAYTLDDVALMRLLAVRVASAIENARLYRRVEQQHRTLQTLTQMAQGFSSILDLDELLHTIAASIRNLINYDSFSILLLDPQKNVLRNRISIRYDDGKDLDEIPIEQGITGAAARLRKPMRVDDTVNDPRYIASHPGIRSEIALPLMLRDRVIGVLDLESKDRNHYTADQVRTLAMLAPQIASAIENARLYEEVAEREQKMNKDLQAGRKLQSLLLPSNAPLIEGLEIAVGVQPAREITGDLFDFFDYENGQAMIVFGDSSGKGAAAALYAALTSGLLRSIGRKPRRPAELLHALNVSLTDRRAESQYATLLAMFWDARQRKMTIANAGGLPPIICRGEQLLDLETYGIPVGMLAVGRYDEISVDLQPGDLVVLTSDGVLDAQNREQQEYGRERLGLIIRDSCALPVQQVIEAIARDVQMFTAGAPQFDDQTILVFRVF